LKQFLPDRTYIFLFSLLCLVYIIGLFVPLMDNDAAHHANIALRMHLTGDYVNLMDNGNDYLDKPHLHFWLCALAYNVFGVTTFAYKFPSFLFTVLGTYSTYRLGKSLYNAETGKLAALLLVCSFSWILANNDVRMDAILAGTIAFTTWQLVDFLHDKRILNLLASALGLALGFCTKGPIAVFTPMVGILFYILYLKDWKILLNWKWLVLLSLFFVFISPVLYCYYLQFDLHPEKIIRGRNHISGLRFILWDQAFERFKGKGFGSDAGNDYFFFLHSFLWAFAPWSLLSYIAFAGRIKSFFSGKEEWLTTGTFAIMLVLISVSGFKLPHYLNIIFPVAAVMTASWLLTKTDRPKWVSAIFIIQMALIFLMLVIMALINLWAFPMTQWWVGFGAMILLSVLFYFWKKKEFTLLQKSIVCSATTMILFFFLLNSNFYPQLLRYQAGNELAKQAKGTIALSRIYFWNNTYSNSFNFYTASLREPFSDSILKQGKTVWLVFDKKSLPEIQAKGYLLRKQYAHVDYEITMLSIQFVNPARRNEELNEMIIAEITGKQ
jgi:4-amino-4-deoxy-L-arabinose transferase-like glycosyltransferase